MPKGVRGFQNGHACLPSWGFQKGNKLGNKYAVGHKLSAESRAKLSESLSGKKRMPCSEETKTKISQANKGKVVSYEVRQKLRVAHLRRWDGIGRKTMSIYDRNKDSKYIVWRNSVLHRDKYICVHCGRIGGKLQAHHIISWYESLEGRYDLNNGITLCEECHKKTDTYKSNGKGKDMRRMLVLDLCRYARQFKDLYLLVADVGFNLVEQFRDEFPDRFINVGIAEQAMIGIAAGLAMQGKKVFCYSLGNFPTLRCLEQIRNDICYHNLSVTIVSSGAGLYYGALGSSHHAAEDIAVMRALPNMRVASPCDSIECSAIVKEIVGNNMPTYVRLQGGNDKELYLHSVGRKKRNGGVILGGNYGITLIFCGVIGKEVIHAFDILKNDNIGVNIISMPYIKPIDREVIKAYSKTTIFTVEEHNLSGGLGSAVLEAISDMGLNTRVVRIGLQDKFVKEVGSQEYLRKINGLDAESIAKKIKEALNV
jgi:transketolase